MPALRSGGSSFARMMTALTGYLRPRPDPSLEKLLRDAFDKFDRDLEIASLSRRDRPSASPVHVAEQARTQCGGWDRHGG